MQYVVKTSDIIEAKGSSLMLREPPRFNGQHVEPGDTVYLWSSGKEGGLVGRGYVQRVARHLRSELELHISDIDWKVTGSLTTADIRPYRDSTDGDSLAELAHVLYFHAHNKVAQLSDSAAEHLSGCFIGPDNRLSRNSLSLETTSLNKPLSSWRSPIWQTKGGRFAIGALLVAAALVMVPLFREWLNGEARQSPPVEAQLIQNLAAGSDAVSTNTPPASSRTSVNSRPTLADESSTDLVPSEASAPVNTSSRKWTEQDAQDACNEIYEVGSSDAGKCKSMLIAEPTEAVNFTTTQAVFDTYK